MKKIFTLLVVLVCLMGCGATIVKDDTGSTTKTGYIKAAPWSEPEVEGMIKVVISDEAYFVSIEKVVDDETIWVDPLLYGNTFFVSPGKYIYKISMNVVQGNLSSLLDVKAGDPTQYIYTEITPTENYVFTWATSEKPGSENFTTVKKKAICVTPVKGNSYSQNLSFSEYAYGACMAVESTNDPVVLEQIGYLNENGIGVWESNTEAINYYERAFKLGNLRAGLRLVDIYYAEEKLADYLRIIKLLVEQDYGHAHLMLAVAYADGNGVEQDFAKSRTLALKAAEKGVHDGFLLMAELAFREGGLDPDHQEILTWLYLYERFNTKPLEYHFSSMARRALNSLSSEGVAQVVARVSEKSKSLGALYKGNMIVADLSGIPEASWGDVDVRLNMSRIEHDAASKTVINNLYTGNDKQIVNVYAGDEIVLSVNFKFSQFQSENLCFFYDAEYEIYEVADASGGKCL